MNKKHSLSIASVVLMLAACGGSGDVANLGTDQTLAAGNGSVTNTSPVRYEGATLIVDGVRYERAANVQACPGNPQAFVCSADRGEYMQGEVLVYSGLDDANAAKIDTELARLGLTVKEKVALKGLEQWAWRINVTPLFEEQWANALNGKLEMKALVNLVMRTTAS
jgi:hypothetical protein